MAKILLKPLSIARLSIHRFREAQNCIWKSPVEIQTDRWINMESKADTINPLK
jgi:hypothetical protein